MFNEIKKQSTIKRYFMKLSLELFSRFGKKRYYSIDQVTHTVQAAGFNTEHVAYAHALFCQEKDFLHHYEGTPFRDQYKTLRGDVSDRYFGGVREFDAANIPVSQQNAQGALIKNFMSANNITPGMQYKVVIVP